jgi:hypothetical protein
VNWPIDFRRDLAFTECWAELLRDSPESEAFRRMTVGNAIKKPAKTLAARRPVAQHVGDQQCSRSTADPNHRQMATDFEAAKFEDHRVAGLAFNRDLRLHA